MVKTIPLLVLLVSLTCAGILAAERHVWTAGRVGRSAVMAPHGIVATSQPLAAQVGLDGLKNGGNATDAAIAANAALGLMEPTSCGVGGDLYALVWGSKTKKLHGLNASGPAAHQATPAVF